MGEAASCNISPLAAGVETGVIPDGDGLIAGEPPQHDLESFHPFAILIIGLMKTWVRFGAAMKYPHSSRRKSS